MTSTGVRLYLFSRLPSSQTRIAYCAPNSCTSPTPLRAANRIFDIGGNIVRNIVLGGGRVIRDKAGDQQEAATGFLDANPLLLYFPRAAAARGQLQFVLHLYWAISGSVPDLKVSVMVTEPAESLVDDIYIRLSMPFIFCSITWVTVSCTVWASAPG